MRHRPRRKGLGDQLGGAPGYRLDQLGRERDRRLGAVAVHGVIHSEGGEGLVRRDVQRQSPEQVAAHEVERCARAFVREDIVEDER